VPKDAAVAEKFECVARQQYKAKQSTRQQRIFEAKFKGLKLFTQEKEQLQENIFTYTGYP
jgi:hypothetical protein